MAKMGRPGLPPERRQEVWERWRSGDSISEISRAVGSPPGSIFSILLPYGGIYQAPKRRRPGALALSQREEISRGLARGFVRLVDMVLADRTSGANRHLHPSAKTFSLLRAF